MAKAPTPEQIRAMSSSMRANLYRNAKAKLADGGQGIVDFIDAEGLPLSDGDMLSSDPDFLTMEEIIWSKEGRAAAIKAAKQGMPALAGVDPLIAAKLGDRYHANNAGTINAGYITAGLMRHLGFVEAGSGPIPNGVAKSGLRWKPRSLK